MAKLDITIETDDRNADMTFNFRFSHRLLQPFQIHDAQLSSTLNNIGPINKWLTVFYAMSGHEAHGNGQGFVVTKMEGFCKFC